MAPRGHRHKKQKTEVYRGGLILQKETTTDKGKAIAEDDSSSSEPEELPSLSSNLKNPDWTKEKDLPKCPTPSRMFNWSAEDYERYDEFLIAKFNALGFSKREKIYVRMRDPNSCVACVARDLYRKWGEEF